MQCGGATGGKVPSETPSQVNGRSFFSFDYSFDNSRTITSFRLYSKKSSVNRFLSSIRKRIYNLKLLRSVDTCLLSYVIVNLRLFRVSPCNLDGRLCTFERGLSCRLPFNPSSGSPTGTRPSERPSCSGPLRYLGQNH